MRIGYVRVSTLDQKTERQETLLEDFGVDKIFIDKASGKTAERPELKKMMEYVREGDTVIVESISRFARSARDFLELMERLTEKDVKFISKKEAIDTQVPAGRFMLTVFAAVAELEREYLRDRQREGIEIARRAGKYRGRKPGIYPGFEYLLEQNQQGNITAAKAMKKLGMSKTTWYRKIREGHRS
ncbi:MAG: recombinase family protein [Clostridiales bacterium]|nr:recombinase family protein [Clostridiales bacterium]